MVNKKDFQHKIFWLLKRVPILYLAGFLIFYSMVNYRDVMDKAYVAALNRLMPNLEPMHDFMVRQKPLSDSSLKDYLMYYRGFEEISGARADVDAMLGFCYYYLGRVDKAIQYYERAVIGNPHFFWFYYNLAVIYFEQGKHEKALKYLQSAIDTTREAAISFMSIAKPYSDLANTIDPKLDLINTHYTRARVEAFKMLVLTHFNLKQYPQVLSVSRIAMQSVPKGHDFFNFYAGLAALEMKELPTALRYFEESMRFSSPYPDSFYFLGVANKLLGNEAVANQAMLASIKLREAKVKERPQLENIGVSIF